MVLMYVGNRRVFPGRGCFVDLDVEKTPIEVCRFAQRAFGIGRCWKIPRDYSSPKRMGRRKNRTPPNLGLGLGALVQPLGWMNLAD
jgi:hypothetical protein